MQQQRNMTKRKKVNCHELVELDDTQPDFDSEPNGEPNLALILKELRELRKDFGQELSGIEEDISKIGKRVE